MKQQILDLISKTDNSMALHDLVKQLPKKYFNGNYHPVLNELDQLDKDMVILLYCRSGSRSGNTLEMMQELGFREVYNMLGGINRWLAEGYTIVQ